MGPPFHHVFFLNANSSFDSKKVATFVLCIHKREKTAGWKKGEGENDENKVPNCFQQHKKNERGRNESRSGWSSALNKFLQNVTCLCKSIYQTLAL